MAAPVTRLAYTLNHGLRVAWYTSALLLARRNEAKPTDASEATQAARGSTTSREALFADMARLFAQDVKNADAGIYRLAHDWFGPLDEEVRRMRLFFNDVPAVARRRAQKSANEPLATYRGKRPAYYLQNFHYQSDGWMSEDSAARYDMQVEVLFGGTAAAMRRQTIAPIAHHLKGRDQRSLRLLDVGAGTARWLKDLRPAFPALPVTIADMSEAYLSRALAERGNEGRLTALLAKAEALPLAECSQDIVTAIYLFHELPPKIRRAAAAEIARVLKPGGLFVMNDSLQRGDHPPYDGMLERFPHAVHEPYYAGYLGEDLNALFGAHGLTPVSRERAFLSTVAAFRKG
ncbi:MAG: class I SAM-dependent methyltransferase [Hyphomicrobiales bacterium]|nr:class I SAM-dependent methyltransferase [Hyphomicrobiales bacterium]OQW81673.1 MAG: hypothetical protein BVN31_10385 [Proteobacteria bacterium ST_bin15]